LEIERICENPRVTNNIGHPGRIAMTVFDGSISADASYATAAFGLFGTLIGGLIAGTVSWLVALQARQAAEHAWIRDARREIYDRYLTSAQRLLIACDACRDAVASVGAGDATEINEAKVSAHTELFEVYPVVQTVAEDELVEAVHVHAYRLLALEGCLDLGTGMSEDSYGRVTEHIRKARPATINAMRKELNLNGTIEPAHVYNPFRETDLADEYAAAYRTRPG
jgi:hypothetical protein